MKRRHWLLIVLAISAAAVLLVATDEDSVAAFTTAVTGKRTGMAKPTAKPICSSPVNPNVAVPTDCIPAYIAQLPPDPGPQGMHTIEGIDADSDGVRDDVQRLIVLRYGHSERAVRALRLVALGAQQEVLLADSLSREDSKALTQQIVGKPVTCYVQSVSEEIRETRAMNEVVLQVVNTPERHQRKNRFEVQAAGVYELPTESLTDLCGYNPTTLPN